MPLYSSRLNYIMNPVIFSPHPQILCPPGVRAVRSANAITVLGLYASSLQHHFQRKFNYFNKNFYLKSKIIISLNSRRNIWINDGSVPFLSQILHTSQMDHTILQWRRLKTSYFQWLMIWLHLMTFRNNMNHTVKKASFLLKLKLGQQL